MQNTTFSLFYIILNVIFGGFGLFFGINKTLKKSLWSVRNFNGPFHYFVTLYRLNDQEKCKCSLKFDKNLLCGSYAPFFLKM